MDGVKEFTWCKGFGMMTPNILITFLFSIALYNSVHAQFNTYKFQNYNDKHCLSISRVNNLNKDADGFMWVATSAGLNRFDDYNFKVFQNSNGDENSISKYYFDPTKAPFEFN